MSAEIKPAKGTLGILTPGMGAVTTTLMGGVEAVRKGWARPYGSETQMGRIRLGKRTEGDLSYPFIKDFVPLASLPDLRFGGWDIFPDNAYEAAAHAEVLEKDLLEKLQPFLTEIRPMKGVFDPKFVRRLRGTHIKTGEDKMDLARQVMDDIARFKESEGCDRLVMVFCASTEAFMTPQAEHQDLPGFEKALQEGSDNISPSMIYAYAALQSGVPFANGTPGLTVDIPALTQLAEERNLPVAGKDFKTGQTLLKTILAPGIQARKLRLDGWASLNILGNRDGEVLEDPGSFESKRVSKGSVLDEILQPELYPELYGEIDHLVKIHYYGPAGDNKRALDEIDIAGWLGRRMRITINWECRDSILAAPVVLDLALFMDLAQRANLKGIAEWLSFYFKSPMTAPNLPPVHNLFEQQAKLHNNLRHLMGKELITHLGTEYYH